jgi:Spy/CpxP family protein refolding chaperone
MKKFKFFSLIFTLLPLGFAISTARAQDEMPPEDDDAPPPIERQRPPQNRRPELLRALNLSPRQIQQIRRVNQSQRAARQEAQYRLREANRALDEAIYADAPDENLVRERMKQVQTAQAELIKLRTATEFAIRQILTPEQLAKFRQLRLMFMRRLENNWRRNAAPLEQNPAPESKPVNHLNKQKSGGLRRSKRRF